MNKNKILAIFFLSTLFLSLVSAVDCPDGERYDSYWQKCQSLCNSYQQWDSSTDTCISKTVVDEDSRIKGYISSYTGSVFIERGLDVLTPGYNEPFYAGDTIVVGENSRAELKMSDGSVQVIDKQVDFKIPAAENAARRTPKITLFFGTIWKKMKDLFGGEKQSYVETPTVVAGVRG